MPDSAFLSRLPVKGATFVATGADDAFKLPLLNAAGKLDANFLASRTIYSVANTAARLAMSGPTTGDIVLQTDTNSLYVLKAPPISTASNWLLLSDSSGLITSINANTTAIDANAKKAIAFAIAL
jgi:hypothetical protein